jgi:hypothetical protein
MKHGNFSFEDKFRKLYTEASQECKINEIKLYDTNTRICIFYIENIHYISVYNVIDTLEYFFDFKLDNEIYNYIKSCVQTYRLGDVDNTLDNEDLEVCKAEDITNQVYQLVFEKQKLLLQDSEQNLFNEIEMGSMSKTNTISNQEHLNSAYPFMPNWNESSMDDILQNIYSTEYNDPLGTEDSQIKKYPGRGRCRVKQANLKERPFVCDYPDCKRAFKRFEHLKRHNKMHTGERPYKCKYPGCMKAFSRSDNLSQHFKIHNISSKGHSLSFRTYQYSNKDID